MKEAMRAKDRPRLEAVRLLRAAIQRREIDERTELDNDGVLSVVQKMIKQGHDAVEQFEKGNRDDLVSKETEMLRVLEDYLPAHHGFQQLAIIREREKDYAEAIRLCREAMAQGWGGEWEKRIARCENRLAKLE